MQNAPLNLVVHHRNQKTGKIENVTPYRLHIEGRVRYFEMPTGSGEWFYENGEKVPAEKAPKELPKVPVRLTEEQLRAKHQKDLYETQVENDVLRAKIAELEAKQNEAKQPQTPKVISKNQ